MFYLPPDNTSDYQGFFYPKHEKDKTKKKTLILSKNGKSVNTQGVFI